MKKILIIAILFLSASVYSQDINAKLGTNGKFIIRDTVNTFMTLSQTDGTINLSNPVGGNKFGSILKGGSRFLHTYFANGTTGYNVFLGYESGNFTMSGTGLEGSFNTGVGYQTLTSLTTGNHNSAYGIQALFSTTTGNHNSAFGSGTLVYNTNGDVNSSFGALSMTMNTTGDSNSAFGFHSLFSNTQGGSNSAFGIKALYSNTNGFNNCAFGLHSMQFNLIGAHNTAVGPYSLYNNISGGNNVALGNSSMFNTTSGSNNIAIGTYALYNNVPGNFNIAIGYQSGANITGNNNIAIGYDAAIPLGLNNQVRIGNTSITYAGIQVAWTITSDRRWKDNIKTVPLGLEFISKLNPVSYTRKNDISGKTEYGLIAQEFEQVLKECGVKPEETGMLNIDSEGRYELRYNDLFAPVIKAIKELKAEKDELKNEKDSEISKLSSEISALKNEMNIIKQAMEVIIREKNDYKEVKQSVNNN